MSSLCVYNISDITSIKKCAHFANLGLSDIYGYKKTFVIEALKYSLKVAVQLEFTFFFWLFWGVGGSN